MPPTKGSTLTSIAKELARPGSTGLELVGQYAERMAEREARATPELPEAPHKAPLVGGRETSPELASLAAKYIKVTGVQMSRHKEGAIGATEPGSWDALADDVRRLAASVLSQTEPKP